MADRQRRGAAEPESGEEYAPDLGDRVRRRHPHHQPARMPPLPRSHLQSSTQYQNALVPNGTRGERLSATPAWGDSSGQRPAGDRAEGLEVGKELLRAAPPGELDRIVPTDLRRNAERAAG